MHRNLRSNDYYLKHLCNIWCKVESITVINSFIRTKKISRDKWLVTCNDPCVSYKKEIFIYMLTRQIQERQISQSFKLTLPRDLIKFYFNKNSLLVGCAKISGSLYLIQWFEVKKDKKREEEYQEYLTGSLGFTLIPN